MQQTKTISLELPLELVKRLEEISEITNQSVTQLVVTAIEQYLDSRDWQSAAIQEAVTEADSPNAVFLDHDDVVERLRIKRAGK